jgi:hypothetical protein
MWRFAMMGAVMTVGTVLRCLLPQLEARQRGPTVSKHVKSAFKFNETTPAGEFCDRGIHNVSTDSDTEVVLPDRTIGHFVSQFTAADGSDQGGLGFSGAFGMPMERPLWSRTVR